MKVLWLCSWYPSSADPYDGDFVERHARSLAVHNHVDVIHILQNVDLLKGERLKPERKKEKKLYAEIYYLPFYKIAPRFISQLIFNLSYNIKIRKALKKYIKESGKPDIIHIHVPVKAGVITKWLKNKWNIPYVLTEHNSGYDKDIPGNYFERNTYFKSVTKYSIENATAFSSVSNWLIRQLNGIFKLPRSIVVRNSVDVSLFYPVETLNETKQFIHVSMMYPLKNVDGILNALTLLNQTNRNWKMQFIGPATDEYKQLSKALGLDKQVQWSGTLPYTEVAKQMQKADALVHFSHYENLPCVINEALCCGIPVISSDVGGIAELINETNGILVEKNNTKQLAEALNNFLQNPDRFNKTNISSEASAIFNYSAIGKQILDLYKEVLSN